MLKSTATHEMTIVYRRLPNDIREFPGLLRSATAGRLVIESPISVDRPIKLSNEIIADTGYLAIWSLYKNRWYDVGKFYDRDRRWIGYYCDIIKPVKKLLAGPTRTVTVTDLFLDLWITRKGQAFVLDEDELESALLNRHISVSLSREATRQIRSLERKVRAGRFPPLEVQRIDPLTKSN
jgi:predicted RNA-binding protein associated with RNAse of E/G family